MTATPPVVLYEVSGPVATVTMNRPEKRNAQNLAMLDELTRAVERAGQDDAVRVIVVAGAGPSFCSGHDLAEIAGDADVRARRATSLGTYELEREYYFDKSLALRDVPKPTVARVQGACVAAGLITAAMCDVIVAADDAFFADPVLRLGEGAAAVEILFHPWEMGVRRAKQFLFLGERLDAAEAHRYGLVNFVVPRADLDDETRRIAERIAEVPPHVARLTKESLNRTLDAQGQRTSWEQHFLLHQMSHVRGGAPTSPPPRPPSSSASSSA